MKILKRIEVSARRWPWQGYGWFPHKNKTNSPSWAPLNNTGSRFGGGWDYKLGFAIGGSTLHLDLLFGSVSISLRKELPCT